MHGPTVLFSMSIFPGSFASDLGDSKSQANKRAYFRADKTENS